MSAIAAPRIGVTVTTKMMNGARNTLLNVALQNATFGCTPEDAEILKTAHNILSRKFKYATPSRGEEKTSIPEGWEVPSE